MTVGSWLGTLFLLLIPVVNIVCILLWTFGLGNKSRVSLIRAYVVILILAVILYIALRQQILTFVYETLQNIIK